MLRTEWLRSVRGAGRSSPPESDPRGDPHNTSLELMARAPFFMSRWSRQRRKGRGAGARRVLRRASLNATSGLQRSDNGPWLAPDRLAGPGRRSESESDRRRWHLSPVTLAAATPSLRSRKQQAVSRGDREPRGRGRSASRVDYRGDSTTSVSSSSSRAGRPHRPTSSTRQTPSRGAASEITRASVWAPTLGAGDWRARPKAHRRDAPGPHRPRGPDAPLAGEGSPTRRSAATAHQPQDRREPPEEVFSKLGITSRTQLDRALLQRADVALRV